MTNQHSTAIASPSAINLDKLASQLPANGSASIFDGGSVVYRELIKKLNDIAEVDSEKKAVSDSNKEAAKKCIQALHAIIIVRIAAGIETTSICRLLSRYSHALRYVLAGNSIFQFEDYVSERDVLFAANELLEISYRDVRLQQKAFAHTALQFVSGESPEYGKFGTLAEIGSLNAKANRRLYESNWFESLKPCADEEQ